MLSFAYPLNSESSANNLADSGLDVSLPAFVNALVIIVAICSLVIRASGENVVSDVPFVIPILYAFNTSLSLVSVNGFLAIGTAFCPVIFSYIFTTVCANSFLVMFLVKFASSNISGIKFSLLASFSSGSAHSDAFDHVYSSDSSIFGITTSTYILFLFEIVTYFVSFIPLIVPLRSLANVYPSFAYNSTVTR